jgi:hypothetical protein
MKMKTLSEAQENLPELVKQAQGEAIGLTDEAGNLVGVLAGVSEEDLDDLLVRTPAFRAMIARSRDSLNSGPTVSAKELLTEARSALAKERTEGR